MQTDTPETKARAFYKKALAVLVKSNIPFMLGGGFALREYTGINRIAPDLDIFCKPEDYPKLLSLLEKAGYHTERTYPWWLVKAIEDDSYIDIIFSSGNGICTVDDLAFSLAHKKKIFGLTVNMFPAEEMFWSKAFVMTRERYDGGDLYHLILKRGKKLNWQHIFMRLEPHWELLLSHLIIFRFIYPSEIDSVPSWIMKELLARQKKELTGKKTKKKICRGVLLSIGTNYSDSQYKIDVAEWGFMDPRPAHKRPVNVKINLNSNTKALARNASRNDASGKQRVAGGPNSKQYQNKNFQKSF